MKKILIIPLILTLILCACTVDKSPESEQASEKPYTVGIWFSYSEIDNMLSKDFKSQFKNAVINCKTLGITDIFFHTVPFCDAFYKSEYYPLRKTAENLDFDPLEYAIEVCHSENIRFHAWINPYRVKTANRDISTLPKESPAVYLREKSDAQTVCFSNGVYLNPASVGVTKLIINSVKELILNYGVDGIHFDDYFYPTQSADFDKESYLSYKSSAKDSSLSLEDWRRNCVNMLISSVNRVIESLNADTIFSISPAASLENNYSKLYADVKFWIDNGYVDWIIVQIYFGFNYPDENFRFLKLLDDWQKLCSNKVCRLMVGLAAYKVGNETYFESEEWSSGDVLFRQSEICREKCFGHCYFSYSSLFSNGTLQRTEREKLLNKD